MHGRVLRVGDGEQLRLRRECCSTLGISQSVFCILQDYSKVSMKLTGSTRLLALVVAYPSVHTLVVQDHRWLFQLICLNLVQSHNTLLLSSFVLYLRRGWFFRCSVVGKKGLLFARIPFASRDVYVR